MFIAILGRQPELSLAELEAVFGVAAVQKLSDDAAIVDAATFELEKLGGTLKYGTFADTLPLSAHTTEKIAAKYIARWEKSESKKTLGISFYGGALKSRDVQKIGIIIKNALKKKGVSVRLIPNQTPALSTATTHHNKLGKNENRVELLIVEGCEGKLYIAEGCGAQNINAYTARDRNRPKRDAFVGMLPPKLAQIMLNLAVESSVSTPQQPLTILDPFCGTGTVLQEALLRNFSVIGTDLSEKMIDFTKENVDWLRQKYHIPQTAQAWIAPGDAMTTDWENISPAPIHAVVCETYLGQPFSAPPLPEKLEQVRATCTAIISQFLKNIHPQIAPGTRLCIAVPAWQQQNGLLAHLPLTRAEALRKMGYHQLRRPLLYRRETQVVAREILVLECAR